MSHPLPDPIIMIAKQAGDVRIHTFISCYVSNNTASLNIANATHIIESKNKLVLVDSQFLAPYATQFRAYADSLGKPIERLYISHGHPDHWYGLGTAFNDIAVYALPETIDFIKQNGEQSLVDHQPKMGDLAPTKIVIPGNAVNPGKETIDGVEYIYDRVTDTEFDYLLTIKLPELKVYITQDLIYSGSHLYLTNFITHWISVLGTLLRSDYELFMPGHGVPADKNEVARNIEYLAAAKQAINNGLRDDAFQDFMIQRYPDRLCPGIFDIYIPRLFDGAGQF